MTSITDGLLIKKKEQKKAFYIHMGNSYSLTSAYTSAGSAAIGLTSVIAISNAALGFSVFSLSLSTFAVSSLGWIFQSCSNRIPYCHVSKKQEKKAKAIGLALGLGIPVLASGIVYKLAMDNLEPSSFPATHSQQEMPHSHNTRFDFIGGTAPLMNHFPQPNKQIIMQQIAPAKKKTAPALSPT